MESQFETRTKTLFMSLWDGISTSAQKQITVVGATNRIEDIDDAIRRRLPYSIKIPLPDKLQRISILKLVIISLVSLIFQDFEK
jgi:SpoVK/Ycf46/Vps4 family AAA+-type ATPase